ncbi:MAG: DUF167 domain-containing protein [Treponema sp.]|jgi:uncharacterized protein (TIGR00251 family)|nr:DUF167 domain-containing protein [Treponema sp.]
METCWRIEGDFLYLSVKALPGSSRNQLGGVQEGALKVKVAAAPEDGRANRELRGYLAKLLGCPKSGVVLAAGEKSRQKLIRLPALYRERLERLLAGE